MTVHLPRVPLRAQANRRVRAKRKIYGQAVHSETQLSADVLAAKENPPKLRSLTPVSARES